MFNKKKENTIKDDRDLSKLERNREFGELGDAVHKKEKWLVIIGLIMMVLISVICLFFIPEGWIICIIMYSIMLASYPLFQYVIKIPYAIILVVDLTKDSMIGMLGIYYIPLHILPDYDISGNMPPLKTQDGSLIYIADKFDMENKVIHMPLDERWSNLRYLIKTSVFLELKDKILEYANKNMRRIMVEDITILNKCYEMLEKFSNAIFLEPEKYFLNRDFGQKSHDAYGSDKEYYDNLDKLKEQHMNELKESLKDKKGEGNGITN